MQVHPLERFRLKHQLTQAAAARQLGISPQKFCDLVAGRARRLGPELAYAVEARSGGEVTASEIFFFTPKRPRGKTKCPEGLRGKR